MIAKSFRFSNSVIITLFGLFCCLGAYAQSGNIGSGNSTFVNGLGRPLGGYNVAVCSHPASGGYPCSNLANVYTDSTFTTILTGNNPTITDPRGNWGWWVLPGIYDVQIYGLGVFSTTQTISASCVPTSPTSCAGPLVTNTLALKPATSDDIQYVSPNGSDSNDGLSMGSAKATILGAHNALPSGGGTIYVTGSGAQCTPTTGQGLGFASSQDSNYVSIPEVLNNVQWVRAKFGPEAIVGLAPNENVQNSTTGWTTSVSCGNLSTPTYGLWLSGISGFTISHLRIISKGIRIAIDSGGSRTGSTAATTNIVLDHNSFRVDCATCGPTLDVGGNWLWGWLENNSFETTETVTWGVSANSSQASNIFFSNNNGLATGLIWIKRTDVIGGGGLRFDAMSGGSQSIFVDDIFEQASNDACQPPVEIINTAGTFIAQINNVGWSDCNGNNPPFVKVAAGNSAGATIVSGINAGAQVPAVEGPMTIVGGEADPGPPSGGVSSAGSVPSAGVIPAVKNQRGLPYSVSQYADPYRRSFSPSLVRFANGATQLPSTWTGDVGTGLSLTQIQGPGDPSGITNAATLSCTANGGTGSCDYYIFAVNKDYSAGDYVYIGAWVQAASTAGFSQSFGPKVSAFNLSFPSANGPTWRVITGGPTVNSFGVPSGNPSVNAYLQNDGNWQYVWVLAQATSTANAAGAWLNFAFQAANPINVYAPMYVQIPASSVALVAAPTFSSAAETGNITTFTTSAPHHLSIGMPITISACSISGYNGSFVLGNTIGSTTFTLYNSSTGLGSPTGCVITPGNDSEIADWANNVSSYSDSCSIGTWCGIRNSSFPVPISDLAGPGSGTNQCPVSSSGGAPVWLPCSTVAYSPHRVTFSSVEYSTSSMSQVSTGITTTSITPSTYGEFLVTGNFNWVNDTSSDGFVLTVWRTTGSVPSSGSGCTGTNVFQFQSYTTVGGDSSTSSISFFDTGLSTSTAYTYYLCASALVGGTATVDLRNTDLQPGLQVTEF